MGRPKITGPTVVVEVEGNLLIWTDGLLTGTNKELLKTARFLSTFGLPVSLTPFGPVVLASLDFPDAPERAVAAMLGARPGRGTVLEAPDEVLALFPYEKEMLSPEPEA